MFKKVFLVLALCGSGNCSLVASDPSRDLTHGPSDMPTIASPLQSTHQSLPTLETLLRSTGYTSNPEGRVRAMQLWSDLVRICKDFRQGTEFLLSHAKYMSDNHHSLYQEEYSNEELAPQDVEAFYLQELAEIVPDEKIGLIKAYEAGKGMKKDGAYALLLKAAWRL